MNTKPLDIGSGDSLDDLLGARSEAVRPVVQPPASYQPKDFSEPCPKCRGTGRFTGWSGRTLGQCFACKGAGKKSFKTSSTDRARSRENAQAREAAKAASALDTFKAEHPDVWAWMDGSTFEFAVSLRGSLERFGSLAFIADPKAAAEAYGQETGVCCICNATLTSEWRLRGIGPICAQKFGW